MARVTEYHIARYAAKRVLLVAEERKLRSRLRSEFELAGCDVVSREGLTPPHRSSLGSYDVVLIDAAVLPGANRLELLRHLRLAAAKARLVLLVDSGEQELTEQARQTGFDAVRERAADQKALPGLIHDALGQPYPSTTALPAAMEFEFLLERWGRAQRHRPPTGVNLEAVPVARDPRFLAKTGENTVKRRARFALTSVVVHVLALAGLLLIPLWHTERVDFTPLQQTWLAAPPPPAPPPPPAGRLAAAPRPRKRTIQPALEAKVALPTAIPKQVAPVADLPVAAGEPVAAAAGVPGGIPGGVPGGQLGGVSGGVLGGVLSPAPPSAKPMAPPPGPVRVGGTIPPPRLLKHVQPIYPPTAKRARLEGEVRIDAVIDPSGRVVQMRILDGHPLLGKAALEAVGQWRYQPTLLNGRPVSLALEITVHFQLS